VFSASNSSRTNVTELTKGEYEIQLTVTDDNHNNASDTVVVTVTQSKFVSQHNVLPLSIHQATDYYLVMLLLMRLHGHKNWQCHCNIFV
jgi:hypothetical protein